MIGHVVFKDNRTLTMDNQGAADMLFKMFMLCFMKDGDAKKVVFMDNNGATIESHTLLGIGIVEVITDDGCAIYDPAKPFERVPWSDKDKVINALR